ncbi:hypothetical protein J6590_046859 [Homalodisca vitripennis]|nr:hypothetical protein J6590_046859 [Homalodisca vitripennis]
MALWKSVTPDYDECFVANLLLDTPLEKNDENHTTRTCDDFNKANNPQWAATRLITFHQCSTRLWSMSHRKRLYIVRGCGPCYTVRVCTLYTFVVHVTQQELVNLTRL